MARHAIDADAAADEQVLVVANPRDHAIGPAHHHHKYLPNCSRAVTAEARHPPRGSPPPPVTAEARHRSRQKH